VEYAFVIEIICCLWHGDYSVTMRTVARARAATSFCIRSGGRGVGYRSFLQLMDSHRCQIFVVVSGSEYGWRVCSSYWICLVLRIFTQ